jgi:O-antigen ligase
MLLRIVTMLPVLWGTFAFGAVYRWAYMPLAWACAAVGVVLIALEFRGRPPLKALIAAMMLTALAVTVQLIPFPARSVDRLSPAIAPYEQNYKASYGLIGLDPVEVASPPAQRTLSIAPDKTETGLLLFCALAVFLIGTTRFLSATGGAGAAKFLIGTGVVLALVGIGQYTLTLHDVQPLVYGFWKPQFRSRPFGPFVNPNHFAGWMLMVTPLALALFYDALEQTMTEMRRLAGSRISIASSPRFGTMVIFAISAAVMGLSLLMTRSRSGLAALGVASALAAWVVFRRQQTAIARFAVIGSFLLLLGGAAVWAGADALTSKFEDTKNTTTVGGRIAIWNDTLRIFHDFPWTGSGLDTYGTAMLVYQTFDRTSHYQEAHNEYLQVLAEGGILVGAPVVFMLGAFALTVRRRFREAPKEGTTYWVRVGAVIGLMTIAAQSLVEFSLQMPGNAALFAVMAAIALHQSPRLRVRSELTGPRLRQHTGRGSLGTPSDRPEPVVLQHP